jgi:FMN-dependent oxidoreductase (nitrilotriacetate monooxygenase family)
MQVVFALWDGWDDDAMVFDQSTGMVYHSERVRPAAHRGKYFSVDGPLNCPRPPQGHPVIMQAGASQIGRNFAARYADVAFTNWTDIEDARLFREQTRERVANHGRDPEQVLVFPGVIPVIGATREAAEARLHEIDNSAVLDAGLAAVAMYFGVDPSELALDEELPKGIEDRVREGFVTVANHLLGMARRDSLTVEQLVRRQSWAAGHLRLVGTGTEIADGLQQWYEAGAADGFNVELPAGERDFELFVEHVLPELRRRGIFREEYTGSTLREHYGL